MTNPIRWGILGTGNIAKKFASELPNSRHGQLAAIASRTDDSARKFADQFSCKPHGSYEALLQDGDIDAVYISVPHPLHAKWAIAAAEAGKHILCEKPLTLCYADAMTVIETARRQGVFLMEAFMYRCHERTQKIVGLIQEGRIGKVRKITASFNFNAAFNPESRLFKNALGGGGILDIGCYATSIARLIAGAAENKPFVDPVAVKGVGRIGETGVDEIASAILDFPGGVIAEISCGIRLSQPATLRIFGDRGMIEVPEFWNPPGETRILDYQSGSSEQLEATGSEYKYAIEADVLAESLPSQEAAEVSWADTLGNMKTLDLWRESIGLKYEAESACSTESKMPLSDTPLQFNRFKQIPHGSIKGLDKPVSRLVLGIDNQPNYRHLAAMADDFIERGGNTFDTAYIYGQGKFERQLGEWIRNRDIREAVNVIVKGGHTPFCKPEHIRSQFDESMERLQTNSADIYLIHRDNPDIPVGEFVDVLNDLKSAGKVRSFGGSNWSLKRLQEANAYAKATGKAGFSVVSNNLSLAQMVDPVWRGCVNSKGMEWSGYLEEAGISLLAWSSQARGYFIGEIEDFSEEVLRCWDSPENRIRRERAQELAEKHSVSTLNIALAFVLRQPFSTFALIGPRVVDETRTSMPGAKLELTQAEIKWLDLAE